MWLLEPSVWRAMEHARASGITPTAEQLINMEARIGADGSGENRLLNIVGSTAEISIKGVLTNTPDFFAMFFGGGNTVYSEVIAALASAEQDPKVDNIILSVDSPGGMAAGLFETIDAINAVTKPTDGRVGGMAASAAFALVAQADNVTALNRASRIGSVGVVVDMRVREDVVSITSTHAPKKRPDVSTAEGVAMVREELDGIHALFVEALADGRGTTVNNVNADFGQGATLLAEDAMAKGMIDSVGSVTNTTAAISGNTQETSSMNLKDLMAQHPDTYAAAVQEGVNAERDRVVAHLTMGEASGAMETSSAAIKDGTGMTATLQATYMSAGMNRADQTARTEDDTEASAGDNVKPPEETAASKEDKVGAKVLDILGMED